MAKNTKTAAVPAEEAVRLKKRSYWGEIWHRLKKNPVAVVCLVFLVLLVVATVFATWITPYDYDAPTDYANLYAKPSLAHPFGCDELGRDLLTRLLVGGPVLPDGSPYLRGHRYRGRNGHWRVVRLFRQGSGQCAHALHGHHHGHPRYDAGHLRVRGPWLRRVADCPGHLCGHHPHHRPAAAGSTLLVNSQEYIEAARTFGESSGKIILTHVIPNCMAPIIVQASMYLGGSIMAIAGLSFIGLGVQPPTPEWGNILNTGLDNVSVLAERWHTIVFPALFIILTMLAFNLLGDGLRDAMDPRMRK